jgi:hypothetical protein
MCFCSPLSWDTWTHDSAIGAAPTADHAAEIKNCPHPQDIKQLPPFFAQLCSSPKTFDRSPEGGGAKTLQWTATAQEAFQQAKRLLAAAVPLQYPAPNVEFSPATAKVLRPLATPRFLFLQTNGHRITLFNF